MLALRNGHITREGMNTNYKGYLISTPAHGPTMLSHKTYEFTHKCMIRSGT